MNPLLYAFPDERDPAQRAADAMRLKLVLVQTHVFPDGEILPRVGRATPTTFVYRSLNRPNEKLVELLLTADALRRQGARRIVLIAPYLPYMRQDKVFRPGEPMSQRTISGLLDRAFDRLVTVDPHLHRTRSLSELFHEASTTLVHSADALVPFLQGAQVDRKTIVVGPDEESALWVRRVAQPLGIDGVVLTKRRRGDHAVEIILPPGLDVRSKPVLLVDDVCSSGSTLCAVVRVLRSAGSLPVTVFVTHALCGDDVLEQLRNAGAERLISADACVHPTNVVQLAPIFAETLKDELSADP